VRRDTGFTGYFARNGPTRDFPAAAGTFSPVNPEDAIVYVIPSTLLAAPARNNSALSPLTDPQRVTSPEKPTTQRTSMDERRRSIVDADGTSWEVREIRNHDYDRRGGHSLVFESSNAVRRVRSYPSDWYDLAKEELFAISMRR
jgi:hypothetical protein